MREAERWRAATAGGLRAPAAAAIRRLLGRQMLERDKQQQLRRGELVGLLLRRAARGSVAGVEQHLDRLVARLLQRQQEVAVLQERQPPCGHLPARLAPECADHCAHPLQQPVGAVAEFEPMFQQVLHVCGVRRAELRCECVRRRGSGDGGDNGRGFAMSPGSSSPLPRAPFLVMRCDAIPRCERALFAALFHEAAKPGCRVHARQSGTAKRAVGTSDIRPPPHGGAVAGGGCDACGRVRTAGRVSTAGGVPRPEALTCHDGAVVGGSRNRCNTRSFCCFGVSGWKKICRLRARRQQHKSSTQDRQHRLSGGSASRTRPAGPAAHGGIGAVEPPPADQARGRSASGCASRGGR